MKDLTETEQGSVREAVSFNGTKKIVEERFDTIGPLLGKEAVGKSFVAIALVILCIVLFITFAFRKVSLPVASWKYGIITVVALLHDVLVPIGAFAILGYYAGYEVDTLFVTALLVVLGFSVHDTIVVFDRVRENLKVSHEVRDRKDFATIVGTVFSKHSSVPSTPRSRPLSRSYFISSAPKSPNISPSRSSSASSPEPIRYFHRSLLVTVQQWQKRENP